MSDLQGKTAIVTGASRGIGEAVARHLAQEKRMNVVLAARSAAAIDRTAAQIGEAGGSARAVVCDVARYDAVAAMVDDAISVFGGVDLLINNAGVISPIARISESDPEHWGASVDINLKGVYHALRAVLPAMERAGAGTIINISSGAAHAPMEGWSQYCASKAGVLMLTRAVDKEYGDKGIRSVGLSPGTVATQMQVEIKASGVNPVSQLDPSVHIPPQWVAKAVAWLAAEGADRYLGRDFALRTPEGRGEVGLPPP